MRHLSATGSDRLRLHALSGLRRTKVKPWLWQADPGMSVESPGSPFLVAAGGEHLSRENSANVERWGPQAAVFPEVAGKAQARGCTMRVCKCMAPRRCPGAACGNPPPDNEGWVTLSRLPVPAPPSPAPSLLGHHRRKLQVAQIGHVGLERPKWVESRGPVRGRLVGGRLRAAKMRSAGRKMRFGGRLEFRARVEVGPKLGADGTDCHPIPLLTGPLLTGPFVRPPVVDP